MGSLEAPTITKQADPLGSLKEAGPRYIDLPAPGAAQPVCYRRGEIESRVGMLALPYRFKARGRCPHLDTIDVGIGAPVVGDLRD